MIKQNDGKTDVYELWI